MGGQRVCGTAVEFLVQGVFAELGKSTGSVCTACLAHCNITDCKAAVSPQFGHWGGLLGGGVL